MPSLNELKLSNKPLGDTVSYDDIPAERGAFVPPPQPGSYRFDLPKGAFNFDTFDTEKYGQRLNVIFDESAPLTIAQSPGKEHDGETFHTRINNVPRPRGKEKIEVSDADYLLKAKGVAMPPPKQRTNKDYGAGLQSLAGASFGADIEWSWSCNNKRAARFASDEGAALVTLEDEHSTLGGEDAGLKAGCGNRYYQNDVDKIDGEYPLTITCSNPECGAQVRAFANLRNFKA